MNNPGRPVVDINGNDVEANKYYVIRAIGSDLPTGGLNGGTFLIKRVEALSNDQNLPAWFKNKAVYFDYLGQEVSLDNRTSTFTPVDPSGGRRTKRTKRTKRSKRSRNKN